MKNYTADHVLNQYTKLNKIAIELFSAKDKSSLLGKVIGGARELTQADMGIIYLLNEKNQITHEIIYNDTLKLIPSLKSNILPNIEPIIFNNSSSNPLAYTLLEKKPLNIENIETNNDYDFSFIKELDFHLGYKSKSCLIVPLYNHENESIGVLFLINRFDTSHEDVKEFSSLDQHLMESLAVKTAIMINNLNLSELHKLVFEDFIKVIAKAIDEKSPYTGAHCSRVPVLAMLIADAVNNSKHGKFQNIQLSDDELYELKIAAWLHDCGKVAIPDFIMDKATKLETIFDRINAVDLKFEIIQRDAHVKLLKKRIASLKEKNLENYLLNAEHEYALLCEQIQNDRDFLRQMNIGAENLSEGSKIKIQQIADSYSFVTMDHEKSPILSDDEVKNLQISYGTLNIKERELINNHVNITMNMLHSLHYPKALKNVPEIAGNHHERLDGNGYPRQLAADKLSLQSRILAIADVFEALTAADRPYKTAKSLKESLALLQDMVNDGKLDSDIFDVFVKEQVYLEYAKTFLSDEEAESAFEVRQSHI